MRFVDRLEEDMVDAQSALTRTQKYNCEEVKVYLSNTYRGICAYCECEVEVSNYFEVEHFYPKCQYEGLETDIHNLHLSCKRCNNPKGTKTDEILSPNFYLEAPNIGIANWKTTNKEALNKRIRYVGHMLISQEGDTVANNTISILRLNNDEPTDKREYLINSRLKVYNTAFSFLKSIIGQIIQLAENYKKIVVAYQGYNFYEVCCLESFYNGIYSGVPALIKPSVDGLKEMMEHGHPYSQMVIDNFSIPLYQALSILSKFEWKGVDSLLDIQDIDAIILELKQIISNNTYENFEE